MVFVPKQLTLKRKTTISQNIYKLKQGIVKSLLRKEGVNLKRGIKDGAACLGLWGTERRDLNLMYRCDPKGVFSLIRNL